MENRKKTKQEILDKHLEKWWNTDFTTKEHHVLNAMEEYVVFEVQVVADKYRKVIQMYFDGLSQSDKEVVSAIKEVEEYVSSLLTQEEE